MPTRSGGGRLWRWLAWAWLVAVLALGLQQALFWRQPAIDADVMALLPGSGEPFDRRADKFAVLGIGS